MSGIVFVQGRPVITVAPSDISVPSSYNINLPCEVVSSLPAVVSWFLNGVKVNSTKAVDVRGNYWLSLNFVTSDNSGEYTCVAANNFGKAERKAFLTVDGLRSKYFNWQVIQLL